MEQRLDDDATFNARGVGFGRQEPTSTAQHGAFSGLAGGIVAVASQPGTTPGPVGSRPWSLLGQVGGPERTPAPKYLRTGGSLPCPARWAPQRNRVLAAKNSSSVLMLRNPSYILFPLGEIFCGSVRPTAPHLDASNGMKDPGRDHNKSTKHVVST